MPTVETKKINLEITEHERECREKNDLRYMTKVFFTGAAITIVLSFLAGATYYLTNESAQNQRIYKVEVTTSEFYIMTEKYYKETIAAIKESKSGTDINQH
jgi:hypothetical protein